MPATLKLFRHALDGLVELPLNVTSWRIQLSGQGSAPGRILRLLILLDEAIHAPQKSLDPLDPRFLPIQIAVWRRGEQAVQPGSIRPVASHHLIGRYDVAE